jgi:hypothetical protein
MIAQRKTDLRTCLRLEFEVGMEEVGILRWRWFPNLGVKLLRWPREVVRLALLPATDQR